MSGSWTTYLLRYGEIGIKSRAVRRRFEERLVANIEAHFERDGATCLIEREWGRIFLDTPDPETARHAISHTFGLVSGSPTEVMGADLDAIAEHLGTLAPDHLSPGQTFAIRARRTGEHDYTSQDVGVRGGDAVLTAVPEAEVDLDDPEVAFHVEVRGSDAYVFTEIIAGPGGLPMGAQGQVVVPWLGPRSPAAAWLVMRRGAAVHVLVPEACQGLVSLLDPWAPELAVTVLDGEPTREDLLAETASLVEELEANAVVLDDHEARATQHLAIETAVLRPLAGLPGKRWPEPAYRLAKQAAERHPGPCVRGEDQEAEVSVGRQG